MTFKGFWTFAFFLVFFNFMAVSYAVLKTPGQDRSIASQYQHKSPWYDAAWKY